MKASAAALLVTVLAACSTRPTGPRVYVTNESAGTLSVIDVRSNTVVRTIPLGKRPRGVKASADGRLLYVALSGSPVAGPGVDESKLPPPDRSADGIGVVDLAAGKIVRVIKSGQDPEQLAVGPDGRLFVANEDASKATIIDPVGNAIVAEVPVGSEPEV